MAQVVAQGIALCNYHVDYSITVHVGDVWTMGSLGEKVVKTHSHVFVLFTGIMSCVTHYPWSL